MSKVSRNVSKSSSHNEFEQNLPSLGFKSLLGYILVFFQIPRTMDSDFYSSFKILCKTEKLEIEATKPPFVISIFKTDKTKVGSEKSLAQKLMDNGYPPLCH